ncbi:MAG: hypothetical protein V7K47_06920 [Nostoc sp.]
MELQQRYDWTKENNLEDVYLADLDPMDDWKIEDAEVAIQEYPKNIALIQDQIQELNIEIVDLRNILNNIETEVDKVVALDMSLQNDEERKVKRDSLIKQHPYYWNPMREYVEYQEEVNRLSSLLEKIESELSAITVK